MRELTVETVPVGDLTPHPENPNNGDIDIIAASLAANGQYKPIVVSADSIILAGNHTAAAAAQLGWPTIQVTRLPIAGDSHDARRILLADNQTARHAVYDDGLLAELVASVAEEDPRGLVGTGWDEDMLSDLLDSMRRAEHTPVSTNSPGPKPRPHPEDLRMAADDLEDIAASERDGDVRYAARVADWLRDQAEE